jgi:hypothetical protein
MTVQTAGDLLHDVLMASPPYDRRRHADDAARTALLALVDALAYEDDSPHRIEYLHSLIGMHGAGPDLVAEAIVTAAGWLQLARIGREP